MSRSFHVNGPAHVCTDTGVTAYTLYTASGSGVFDKLGLTVDGVDIMIRTNEENIFDDQHGPMVPAEKQKFLQDARIFVNLVRWDEAVMTAVMKLAADTSSEGTQAAAGVLVRSNGLWHGLYIHGNSGLDNRPWYFPSAHLVDQYKIRRSSRKSLLQLEFHALPWTKLNSGAVSAMSGNAQTTSSSSAYVDAYSANVTQTDTSVNNVLYKNSVDASAVPF